MIMRGMEFKALYIFLFHQKNISCLGDHSNRHTLKYKEMID